MIVTWTISVSGVMLVRRFESLRWCVGWIVEFDNGLEGHGWGFEALGAEVLSEPFPDLGERLNRQVWSLHDAVAGARFTVAALEGITYEVIVHGIGWGWG